MLRQAILLKQLQKNSGFEIEYGKTCPFSSQIGSRISTMRNMHLHLFVCIGHFPARSCTEE